MGGQKGKGLGYISGSAGEKMPHSHTPWWKAAPQSPEQDPISWGPRLTPVNVLLGPLPEKGKLISHSKPVGSGDAAAGDRESAGTGTAGEEDLPRLCREDCSPLPPGLPNIVAVGPAG